MFSSKQITDWILNKVDVEAGDTISPLKLQKLLYYCQAWHLTVFNEKLINEDFEAWAHGPVLRSVYKRFAGFHFMNEPIDIERQVIEVPNISDDSLALLDEVYDIYGNKSASYLEKLTHSEKPWIEARGGLQEFDRCTNIISNETIKQFYNQLKKQLGKERKLPKYLALKNSGANFIDTTKLPLEKHEENGNDKLVFISFDYFQEDFECFSNWTKDEMKQFWKFYKMLTKFTWQQVLASGRKTQKSGLAYTKIKYDQLPSNQLSEDETYFELRVNQNTLRVFGFRSKSIFFICWIDRSHKVCPV